MTAFRLILPTHELHNSNHRGHWSIKARKRAAMREAARRAAVDLDPIHGAVDLTVTFAFPDRRARDLDNVEIKGAIDGAVDVGLIDDDRRQVLRSITRRSADHSSPAGYAVLTFDIRPAGGGA